MQCTGICFASILSLVKFYFFFVFGYGDNDQCLKEEKTTQNSSTPFGQAALSFCFPRAASILACLTRKVITRDNSQ